MKKLLALILVAAFVVAAQAQTPGVTGRWLMTTAEMKGKVNHPYQTADFRKDGKLVMMGIEMGSWKVDPKANQLILQSKLDKDFNGTAKILKLTANEFVIDKDGAKFYYSKIDPEAIVRANKNSGLAGQWKVLDSEYPVAMLKLTLPDSFIVFQASANETDERQGTWIFDPKENAIIFIGFSHLLRGRNQITELGGNKLTLKKGEKIIRAERLSENVEPIERLTFKEDDFPEDQKENQSGLPWTDFSKMVQFLNTVTSVQYRSGKLVKNFNRLVYTGKILSKIKTDVQKPSVEFTNLRIAEGDTSQFSQNYKGHLQESYNDFFPRDELQSYRIAGTKKVTVPAGTFLCTVVEGIDGDKRVKLYMISHKPGIYAKMIEESIDPLDGDADYHVTELEKITYCVNH